MFTFVSLLSRLIGIYETLIFVWALLSWVPASYDSPTTKFREALDRIVEPYVGIFRDILPSFSGIDFSPVLAIVVLSLLERTLIRLLVF